jgi:hypothetical protein
MRRATLAALAFLWAAASFAARQAAFSPGEARAIAKDAYVYGFSLVDGYRILYSYFVDKSDPEYKAGWNKRIFNNARVFTPADTAMQTPNADTPYSQLGLDLRTEPMVLTVPEVERGRYYSVEVNDLYTFISGYIGTRTTGNDAGSFLVAGPGWKARRLRGIKGVIRCETELAFVLYRTQLLGPDDLENVKRVQSGYKVERLSEFLGRTAPPPAPKIEFRKPISAEEERTSPEFFDVLNFVLRFCPVHPSEKALRARFARLGIAAGKRFDAHGLPTGIQKAVHRGMADAWKAYEAEQAKMRSGELTSADLFGSRASLGNNYLYRMLGTVDGIWENAKEEAVYAGYSADSTGTPLDGSANRYVLRFPERELPPVKAFWSLTVYAMPSHLLVANPIDRYLINSVMLPKLRRDGDGDVTILIQRDSPGRDRESNWLPAPDGPFIIALRMYWPKSEVLDGKWKKPAIQRLP